MLSKRFPRSLILMRKKGYITTVIAEVDNRFKAVLPTTLAMQCYDVMWNRWVASFSRRPD